MKSYKKAVALSASALMAIGGIGTTFATAATADADQVDGAAQAVAHGVSNDTFIVKETQVNGQFAFTQSAVTENQDLKRFVSEASKYLCNASTMMANEGAEVEDWAINVRGAVENPTSMSLADFRESGRVESLVMGCSCMGNPVDGRATGNAEVNGIPLAEMLNEAGVEAEANTLVVTSSDGYEIALPMSYVLQRNAIIAFAVNDETLVESVGGVNQLWLGSTPASYFARDVIAIELQARQTPPPSPTSDEARADLGTLPNIGVLYGGDVR